VRVWGWSFIQQKVRGFWVLEGSCHDGHCYDAMMSAVNGLLLATKTKTKSKDLGAGELDCSDLSAAVGWDAD
jgi:hypothetical protein